MNRARTAADMPWASDAASVADELGSDLARGLGRDEAERRLLEVGANALIEQTQPGPWRIFARQFANTMTVVLALAGLITLFIGDVKDTVVIGVIVVLNAVVGFVQEYRAEQAMAALKQLTTGVARVIRDGQLIEVPTPDLVPGDLVELAAGDVAPADLRLVDVHGLRVNEAALTGESESSAKTADTLIADRSMVADRHNMAFRGTAVAYGRARGLVVATGMATELGQIAALLQAHAVEHTPLQRRLAVLGRRMAAAAVVVCGVVFAAGVARGETFEDMFLTSVSLAVAAIPEGLPAIVTVALALGARRMADRHAVIRRLPAVETLGSVTVICSDKTGTLTENRMLVERIWTPTALYEVSGDGYTPDGALTGECDPATDADLARIAHVAAACNDAALHPPDQPGGDWTITGDPTEGALVVAAAKLGIEQADLERRLPRAAEIAFDAGRRRMTTIHHQDGRYWIAAKGALGAIAPLLHADDRTCAAAAETAADELADAGYRVLALAERHADTLVEPLDDLEDGLRLLGLVAIALGLEPAEPDTMRRPPRRPQESILAGGLWQHAVWVGLLMAAVVLPLQAITRAADWPWQTMVFTTLALLQLGHALAVRSELQSTFRLGHRSNPWISWAVGASAAAQLATVYIPALHDVFGTETLTAAQLAVVLVLSTTAFVAVEIEKAIRRRANGREDREAVGRR